MKHKFKYQWGFFVVLAIIILGFQACQNDVEFPDPNFEIGDQRVEVRRDTADVYLMSFKMSVPNKVEAIDVIDAVDYSVVDNVEGYYGQTDFQFEYPVDLTPFEKDTVLNYIVKVLDQDARSYNQGIRIDVKGFSFPQIALVGGTTVATAAPAYTVKGLVTTGLNAISRIKISFKGDVQFDTTYDTTIDPINELVLDELIFLGDLTPSEVYDLDIYIEDDKGQSSVTTVKVFKSEHIKKPLVVNYKNPADLLIKMEFEYDEEERIKAFNYIWPSGNNYRHEFSYNELGMVDTIRVPKTDADGVLYTLSYLYYEYVPGTKNVSNIYSQYIDYDNGNEIIGNVKLECSDFVYNDKGEIESFFTSSKVSNVYYSDPFKLGESIFGEYWQNTNYIGSNAVRRQHRAGYDPVLLSTFIEGMPPVAAPGANTMLEVFNDLFWNKYIMTSTVPTSSEYTGIYLREPAYSYETDDDGNITNVSRINVGGTYQDQGDTYIYNFFY